MATFRFGLAGAGRMGSNHLKAIRGSEAVTVAAIAEPVAASRERLAGAGAVVHASLQAMLDAGGIDAVIVCVPTDLHLETVKALVEAGMPALCEKPVGSNTDEGRRAAALVNGSGLPFQVGFWRRFVPSLRALHDRVHAGALGDVYAVANFQWDGAPPSEAFRASSAGIFVDMGVHEFDQTRWLTGQEFGEVHAAGSRAGDVRPGDPESAQAVAELDGGATALVSLGRRYPLGDVCKVEVFGTRDAEECRFLWPPTADDVFFAALRAQAESFARHVGGGQREGAGVDDAVAALEVAERAASRLTAVP